MGWRQREGGDPKMLASRMRSQGRWEFTIFHWEIIILIILIINKWSIFQSYVKSPEDN
jgi:hypothetical protein